jgi:small subunit ribosomal protein S2
LKPLRNAFNVCKKVETILTTDDSKNYSKKDQLKMAKEKLKLERSLNGIKQMSETPGLLVVVDPNKEHIAIQEAATLGIPVVSITDTNCNPDNIEHVLPANDDALKSVRLFFSEIANACIEGNGAFEIRIQEETRKRMQQEIENKKKAKEAKPEDVVPAPSEGGEKGPIVEKKKTIKKAIPTVMLLPKRKENPWQLQLKW